MRDNNRRRHRYSKFVFTNTNGNSISSGFLNDVKGQTLRSPISKGYQCETNDGVLTATLVLCRQGKNIRDALIVVISPSCDQTSYITSLASAARFNTKTRPEHPSTLCSCRWNLNRSLGGKDVMKMTNKTLFWDKAQRHPGFGFIMWQTVQQ